MIHVMLSEEEIELIQSGLMLAVGFLHKEENGAHFIKPYFALRDKLKGIQDAIKHQTEKENEHEKARM
jgi:hypothetical protein